MIKVARELVRFKMKFCLNILFVTSPLDSNKKQEINLKEFFWIIRTFLNVKENIISHNFDLKFAQSDEFGN